MNIKPFAGCMAGAALLALQLSSPTASAQTTQAAAPTLRVSVTNEEFVGPFASWGNVKTYGAVGDGVTDDTAAIQRALNAMNQFFTNSVGWTLEQPGSPSVMYFPPGTYKITQPLYQQNKYGVSLVGADPKTTTILWGGASGGTMLIADGVYGGKYARLTWNGNSKAGIGVAHWWNTRLTPQQYGASPEHVDEVFTDLGVGIVAGCCGKSSTSVSHPGTNWRASDYGQLDSEGSIKRTQFIRNSVAGLSVESWNALDWWVMDSQFVDCYQGLTNALGAGNILAYRNLFQRSKFADLHVTNTQWFSLHNNVSVNSQRFVVADLIGNNGDSIILKNNRVINPVNATPIYLGNLGPLIMFDNQFLSASGAAGPVIKEDSNSTSFPGHDMISAGNQFTIPMGSVVGIYNTAKDRFLSINDTTVAASTISTALPTMPATPASQNRQVFEVPIVLDSKLLYNTTSTAQIQAVINAAAASSDPNPIVHFPRATYGLTASLVIPAGRRMQLVGDNLATSLQPGPNMGASPLLVLNGPSLATVREMQFYSNGYTATAIQINNADQAGGRILMNGTMSGVTNINNLAQTRVEAQHTTSFQAINATGAGGFISTGAGVVGPVAVNANSNVVLADTWYEGVAANTLMTGTSGNFTYLGGHIAPPATDASGKASGPQILVDNFNGQFTVVGLTFQMALNANGTLYNANNGILVNREVAGTKALFAGISANPTNLYYKRANSGGTVGFATMRASSTAQQGNSGATDIATVTNALSQVRSVVWDTAPATIPSGATDVQLYRVRTVETAVGYNFNK